MQILQEYTLCSAKIYTFGEKKLHGRRSRQISSSVSPIIFPTKGLNKKSPLAMFRLQPLDCKGSPRDQTNRLDDPPSLGTSFAQHCPTFIPGVLMWSLKKKLFLLFNILEWIDQ